METFGARIVFENAKALLQRSGLDPTVIKNAVLTQSSLRLEQPANTSLTVYNFPVLVNDQSGPSGTTYATETRLILQDAMVIAEIGLFLAIPASAAATAFDLYTYPSPTKFATGGAPPAPLGVLYNSNLRVTINNNVILPNWDTERYKTVPETQATAAATPPQDELLRDQGFYIVEPNIVLSGSRDNKLQIVMPGAFSAVDANTRLVIILRGVRAQNVTSVN